MGWNDLSGNILRGKNKYNEKACHLKLLRPAVPRRMGWTQLSKGRSADRFLEEDKIGQIRIAAFARHESNALRKLTASIRVSRLLHSL